GHARRTRAASNDKTATTATAVVESARYSPEQDRFTPPACIAAKKMEAKAPAWPPISQLGALEKLGSFVLRGAVGGDEAGFLDAGARHGGTEAGGFEVRPGALGAGAADLVDIE